MNTNQPAETNGMKEIVFQLPTKDLEFISTFQDVNASIREVDRYLDKARNAMQPEREPGGYFLQADEIMTLIRDTECQLQEIANNISRSIGMLLSTSIANNTMR